jgi:hypothetical protein
LDNYGKFLKILKSCQEIANHHSQELLQEWLSL